MKNLNNYNRLNTFMNNKILFLNAKEDLYSNNPEECRLKLRQLVNNTLGFVELSKETSIPEKSLHRMLTKNGNPTMNNLSTIFKILKEQI
jgi:DNA-binding phage protein